MRFSLNFRQPDAQSGVPQGIRVADDLGWPGGVPPAKLSDSHCDCRRITRRQSGQDPPNKGHKYPAEPLSEAVLI